MRIININRNMPRVNVLTQIGRETDFSFGRKARVYRRGNLMFTVVASKKEFDELKDGDQLLKAINDHLNEDDQARLFSWDSSCEADTPKSVSALRQVRNKRLAEKAEAEAKKLMAEKAKAEEEAKAAAAKLAEETQRILIEGVIKSLQDQGLIQQKKPGDPDGNGENPDADNA